MAAMALVFVAVPWLCIYIMDNYAEAVFGLLLVWFVAFVVFGSIELYCAIRDKARKFEVYAYTAAVDWLARCRHGKSPDANEVESVVVACT